MAKSQTPTSEDQVMQESNSGSNDAPVTKGNVMDRLALLKSRLSVAKTFCKKPHDAWKTWMDEYNIEDFGDTEEVRDKVRVGYIFRKSESDMPSMFDDKPDTFVKGLTAPVQQVMPIINGLYDYLWDCQNLEDTIDDTGLYFIINGMGILTSPWLTKTKKVLQKDEQTGESKYYDVPTFDAPMAESENPFKIFFSPETKFGPVMDAEHCSFYFKEKTMSPEKIKAKWNKTITSGDILNIDDSGPNVNIDLAEDKTINHEDLKRTKVYEYWGTLPETNAPTGKDGNGNPFGPWEYDKEYHIEMTTKSELFIEECPYDHKPLFIIGNYGFANKFWKFGDAKHLMPLIQEFQQYRSHLLEYTRKMTDPKILVPEEASLDEDAFLDTKIGRIIKYTGPQAPTYLSPSPMGKEVEEGIGNVRQDLEKTSGSFDLASGGGQSTVKTPRGIAVYSEAADKNVARKRKKISKLIRQLILFQFKQVAEMWNPEDGKVLPVKNNGVEEGLGINGEVLQLIGGVGQMYTIDIEVETLSLNRVQMKRDALDLWDLAQDHPEIFDLTVMATDLLQNGYGKRDATRYLISAEQKAQMQANAGKVQPKVNVQIKADAQTPVGDQLLVKEGLVDPTAQLPVASAPGNPAMGSAAGATGSTPQLPPELQAMMNGQSGSTPTSGPEPTMPQ